ncbi:MAG: substrate-binding domain-containing protein, partial [Eubacterium sp.]|nr:substrate-binding domain-containing protein [Eubacterium sp.]
TKEGYRVPRDYSVAGFDNSVLSAMPQISLTTVEHAAVQKGRDAVNLIHSRNHQNTGSDAISRITRMEYEPRLIIRQSTGKVSQTE